MTSRRKKLERHHALAAEAVRAYINDEDADLYNITDQAVEQDALAAAWNLTALAAAAVEALAECRGLAPEQTLDDVIAKGYGGPFRAPQSAKRHGSTPGRSGVRSDVQGVSDGPGASGMPRWGHSADGHSADGHSATTRSSPTSATPTAPPAS